MMLWRLLFHIMSLLLILPSPRHGDAYNLTECNSNGNFDIVQNRQPVLTCTGLGKMQSIYWSIMNSSSGNEMRIGTCENCDGGCSGCSTLVEGYNISRDSKSSTTLQFLNHSLVTSGSTIKCSNLANKFNATCTLFVVPEYRFSECRAGVIMVAENKKSPILCESLLAAQNMYWTVTYGNGTVSTIAQCTYCRNKPKTCPKCTIIHADFNVTREDNSSSLVIQNNVRQKDGATLTCSKKDNATHSDCKILVVYLVEANITLHDNWTVTGSVTVSKVPASDNITCLWYNNEMYRLASSAAELTPYNDSNTGNECINVSCRLNTTLSPYMVGSNDIFVQILPDERPFLAATVTVEEPGSLVLDESTCLLSVTEGSHVTCTCTNEDDIQGYPSGRVLWTNNTGSDVLELPNIQQNHSGVVHVCRALWGPHDVVFEMLNYSVTVFPLYLNQEQATGLPVAAVAGSVVGIVAIVAIAIFIAVIFKRRRSKREAAEERRDTMPLDDEFEEHINEFYQSADDPDLPRGSPRNSPTPLLLANPSLDIQGAGSDGPENHVYAQVNKGKKEKPEDNKEKPGKAHDVKQLTKGGQTQKHADKGDKGGPSSEEQGAVYTECVSDNKEDNSVTNVYMNVDESPPLRPDQDTHAAKKDSGNEDLHDPDLNTYHNTETTRHQGDYTNVQLELNDGEGVTKTAETDDEYRHLQFSRSEQLEENPTHNHLEGV